MVLPGTGGRFAPAVRASWERQWFDVAVSAEEAGPDSTRRLDAIASVRPFPWLHLGAAHSIHTPEDAALGGPARTTSRAEAGVRVLGRWLTAGAVQRSTGRLLGLPVFDTLFVPIAGSAVPSATGLEAGVSGQVWRRFFVDWRGTRWPDGTPYTPAVESHTVLSWRPDTRKRFTRGDFDFSATLTHDYRGRAIFPAVAGGGRWPRARATGAGESRCGSARPGSSG